MSLGVLLTFVGLLVASYSIFREDRRAIIHTFVSLPYILIPLTLAVLLIVYPSVLQTNGYIVSPTDRMFSDLGSFLVLLGGLGILYFTVVNARLGLRSAARFRQTLPTALMDHDWPALGRIVRSNLDTLHRLLDAESLLSLYDQEFVNAVVKRGDWMHLELLANCPNPQNAQLWTFEAAVAVGRALLDGEGTILQKAHAEAESSSEFVSLTASESTLLNRTYFNPTWYFGLGAGYPLYLMPIERLESGEFDARYNRASRRYTSTRGRSGRWNCPLWVGIKTMKRALSYAIEAKRTEDFEVEGFFGVYRSLVYRSQFNKAEWESGVGELQHPTPFSYLMNMIVRDLRELTVQSIKCAILNTEAPLPPSEAPQFEPMSRALGGCLWASLMGPGSASKEFIVDLWKEQLAFICKLRYAPYEILQEEFKNTALLESYCEMLFQNLKLESASLDALDRATIRSAVWTLDPFGAGMSEGSTWLEARLKPLRI